MKVGGVSATVLGGVVLAGRGCKYSTATPKST